MQIGDCVADRLEILFELAQGAVAALAEDAADRAADVVVIDVLGFAFAADRTEPALLLDHPIDIGGADAVSAFQVIVATATVESLL